MLFRIILALCLLAEGVTAQESRFRVTLAGFYNLENLFDTIDGPNDDAEFLPAGPKKYTGAVYRDKLEKLARVISGIGTDLTPEGLALLGCAEVENAAVMRDLAAQPELAARHYRIVHYDSPDDRGIDVGLFYNPAFFEPVASEPLHVYLRNPDGTPRHTRDILYVYGRLNGEPVHLLVAHWPSRWGGAEATSAYREKAAAVCRHKIDSITRADRSARIMLMGDLNDDPVNRSVTKVLGCGAGRHAGKGRLFNPWLNRYRSGEGTLAYDGAWNLFDQIILSSAWLNRDAGGDYFHDAAIYRKPWMLVKTGKHTGYPKRSYYGIHYAGGYSDHLPVYVVFLKRTP